MARSLRPSLAGVALVATLSCAAPALAQERLFVVDPRNETVIELETGDSGFGTIIRRSGRIPFYFYYTNVQALAGGRFLIFNRSYGFDLFDTRTFATITLPQWTLQSGVILAFDSDALRPRIFYRTVSDFGVMEGPSFIPACWERQVMFRLRRMVVLSTFRGATCCW